MDEIVEMLHDYVAILAKIIAGAGLTTGDRSKWLALCRLLPGGGHAPEPSEDDDDGMPVQITSPGGFESARLLAVSRDGLRLALPYPLAVNAHTIVRMVSPRGGVEYTFPCKVAWSACERIGLAFDGAPSKTPLSKALLVGGWRRPLDLRTGWGEPTPAALA